MGGPKGLNFPRTPRMENCEDFRPGVGDEERPSLNPKSAGAKRRGAGLCSRDLGA